MAKVNEANILDLLNQGSSRAVLEAAPDSPLNKLLQGLMQDVTDQLVLAVEKRKISASNNLKQSIQPTGKVIIEGKNVSVQIQADFYWKFVNYGVNGTEVSHGSPAWGTQPSSGKSFSSSIQEWIRHKGITLPEAFGTYESFAFAIMAGIRRDGMKPRPFFEDVVNEKLVAYLRKPIEKLLKRSIEVNIISPWQ